MSTHNLQNRRFFIFESSEVFVASESILAMVKLGKLAQSSIMVEKWQSNLAYDS